MFSDWVTGGRQPDRDAAGQAARGPARADRRRRDPRERLPPGRHGAAPGRGDRRADDPVPRHRRPVHADRRDRGRDALLQRHAPRRPTRPSRCAASGSNGGHAAAFAFDLARSVVYTRQGNPAWAGDSRDGQAGPIRSDNLFFGAKPGDVQPDWIDFSKVAIPQADEQQRLLANLIGLVNLDTQAAAALLVLPERQEGGRGDDRRRPRQRRNRRPLRRLQGREPGGLLGRRLGMRPRARPTSTPNAPAHQLPGRRLRRAGLRGRAARQHGLRRLHAGLARGELRRPARRPSPRSYSSIAVARPRTAPTASRGATGRRTRRSSSRTGSGSTRTTTTGPRRWVADRPGMFTGSGMPMRFADLDGTMIDVYQATTQMTDESDQTYPLTCRHAARQRARRRRVTTARSRRTCTPTGRQRRLRRHPRLGDVARRADRVREADARRGSTAATARASAASPGAATRSRSRSPWAPARTTSRPWSRHSRPSARSPGSPAAASPVAYTRADHQGRRVRVLRRDGRRVRRAVRRRHDAARHLRGGCDAGERRCDRNLDDRRGLDLDRGLRDFGRLPRLPGRAMELW